ncbi:MAG: MFS transporter [Bacteroidales bacterium]|jgi:PPP family 3-phenylpropionic acid transporter|nr:MFS transporter [Bacteroidales bacterium]
MKLLKSIEGRVPGMKETVKLPIFYFLLTGAFAAWQSLYNVHLDILGYSSMQIGALNAILISTSALVVPFWGMIADKFGNNRILLLLTSVAALMVFLIGQTIAFHWMLVFIFIISIFHQPAGAVMDGMTMGFIRSNQKYSFGQFRLWASAGYAVFSLVVGYLAKTNTHIIFTIAAVVFLLLSLINLFTLPAQPVTGRSLVNFKSFGIFFRNRKLLLFLIIIFIYGIAITPLLQFLNLYYSDIGADNSFIGLVFFIQAGLEIFYFILGVRMLKKIQPEKIILISMIVSMLRMLLYGFISVPETAIFLSVFHGITIAFFLIGVVEYVQRQTPDHLRTTGQALIWAFHFGAGVTLGNLLLGYIRDHGGMLKAMHVHAAIAAVVVVGTVVFFMVSGKALAKKAK